MLAAYYGRGEDSSKLFDGLSISRERSYHKHLNQYDVIKINMQEFLSVSDHMEGAQLRRSRTDITQMHSKIIGEIFFWQESIMTGKRRHIPA